jgi:hypothetical protein
MTVTSTHENYNCRHLYKIPSAENNSKLHIFTQNKFLKQLPSIEWKKATMIIIVGSHAISVING